MINTSGKITRLAGIVALAMFIAPVSAHHSVAGQFDVNNPMAWEGVVTKVDWINPHIYLYVDVTDAGGAVTEWRLETVPPAMMRRAGISKKNLQGIGEIVSIRGLPARDGTRNLGFISTITFPDGHYYQLDRNPDTHKPEH
jgi:hypothetical protein